MREGAVRGMVSKAAPETQLLGEEDMSAKSHGCFSMIRGHSSWTVALEGWKTACWTHGYATFTARVQQKYKLSRAPVMNKIGVRPHTQTPQGRGSGRRGGRRAGRNGTRGRIVRSAVNEF